MQKSTKIEGIGVEGVRPCACALGVEIFWGCNDNVVKQQTSEYARIRDF